MIELEERYITGDYTQFEAAVPPVNKSTPGRHCTDSIIAEKKSQRPKRVQVNSTSLHLYTSVCSVPRSGLLSCWFLHVRVGGKESNPKGKAKTKKVDKTSGKLKHRYSLYK